MSLQFNNDLIANLDLYDFIGLNDEQAKEKLSQAFDEKTPAEIEGLLEELRVRLSEIQEELMNLQDGLEDQMDAAYNAGNIASGARAENQLEEIDDLLKQLGDVEGAAMAAAEHEALLNVETDIDHYFITDDFNNGDTVTITPTGISSQSGIFGEVEEDIFTFDQDTTNDAQELEEFPTEVPERGQTIWIKLNAGDKVIDVKEEGTTKYFSIVTKDGRRIELVIENVMPGKVAITFEGSQYANPTLFNNLSDDFLKSLFENENRLSFYDIINGTDPLAIPEAEIPEGISNNLEDTITMANGWITEAAENTPWATYTPATARLSPQDTETVREMVEMLYDSAAFQPDGETTLQAAWEEIAQLLGGFSIEKQSTLMGALILHIFKNDYQNFSAFFAGYTEFVKSIIKWGDLSGDDSINANAFEKLLIEILEPGFLASLDYTTAHAAESLVALQWYRELIQSVDPLQVTAVDAQIQSLRGAQEQVDNSPEHRFGDGIQDAINFLNEQGRTLALRMREAWFGAMSNDDMMSLVGLFTSLKNAASVDDLAGIITGFFDGKSTDDSDDLASIFVLLVENYVPSLAQTLFTNENLNLYLKGKIRDARAGAFGDSYDVAALAGGAFKDELGTTGSWDILDNYANGGNGGENFSGQGTA